MLLFALLACTGPAEEPDTGTPAFTAEVCNGRDDDGDGRVDEGVLVSGWVDADGDGAGGEESAWEACVAPAGAVTKGGDCDDADPAVFPDAVESCATPGDDDCDGAANPAGAEGCTDVWADADGDGLGGGASTCVCDPGDRPRTGEDCDPDDVDRGLECPEGAVVALDGARLRDDDDKIAWTLVGAADVDAAPGDELVLSAPAGLAFLTLPAEGDTRYSDVLIGTVALTPYSDRALRPPGDTGEIALIEASYEAIPDSDDPSEAFYTVWPTLRGYRAPLVDAAAWTWTLDPLHTSYVEESLFVADLDGDGIVEAWYASGTIPGHAGEAALCRVADQRETGATEVLRTTVEGSLYHVTPLGDPDGDGLVDLGILTVADDADAVSVYAGPIGDVLPAPTADIVTEALFDLVPLGDLDGDGYDDIGLRGERIHVLRGPLASGHAADLAATRVGPESDDLDESALFVTAGDVGADGTRELVVTDTYWPGRVGGEPLRGAVYVFEGLPIGVADVRAADTRLYGTTYGALGAYPSVLDDGRLLVGAHLEDHAEGRGVFWVLGL
jgi:hypothetical protein